MIARRPALFNLANFHTFWDDASANPKEFQCCRRSGAAAALKGQTVIP